MTSAEFRSYEAPAVILTKDNGAVYRIDVSLLLDGESSGGRVLYTQVSPPKLPDLPNQTVAMCNGATYTKHDNSWYRAGTSQIVDSTDDNFFASHPNALIVDALGGDRKCYSREDALRKAGLLWRP